MRQFPASRNTMWTHASTCTSKAHSSQSSFMDSRISAKSDNNQSSMFPTAFTGLENSMRSSANASRFTNSRTSVGCFGSCTTDVIASNIFS